MIHKPIYTPGGRANEYCELALNIYTGCNHGCTYCYVPQVLHKDRQIFHTVVEPRKDIVESVRRQIEREGITGKLIHLCFTCDPYPADIDTASTRKIIKLIKDSGNNVQILTKGGKRAERDFDLLDSNDWFGVTYSCGNKLAIDYEVNAAKPSERIKSLLIAREIGIKTWLSCEPVLEPRVIYNAIETVNLVDLYRIGKLNYSGLDHELKKIHDSINWGDFGHECVRLCKKYGRNYYIKEDLRKEMGQ